MLSSLLYFGIFAFASVNAGEVCYGKYGCFNSNPPFNRLSIPLPQSPADVQTTYHVFTRSSDSIIDDSDVAKLQASSYDGSKHTVVLIHGWTESVEKSSWLIDLRTALLNNDDINLIKVDWKEGAAEFYTRSVANTRLVGAQVAELIKFLNAQTNNSPASFHVIGFSLGAHVAGYAGRRLQNVKLGRITGLDPAGPYYHAEHTDVRLDSSDAEFVDVIHTDAGALGMTTRSGHVDFYPNGGRRQRGCAFGLTIDHIACDHMRAHQFYIDSILHSCPFNGYACSSWDQFTRGNCMSCPSTGCAEMGYNAVNKKGVASGAFYLYTNKQSPFCVYKYVYVTFETAPNRFSWPFQFFSGGRNPKIRIYGSNGGDSGEIELEKRDLAADSTERFIAPLKADLGALNSIQVWNDLGSAGDGWKLNKVTIQFVLGGQSFTACYNGMWIHLSPKQKSLHSSSSC